MPAPRPRRVAGPVLLALFLGCANPSWEADDRLPTSHDMEADVVLPLGDGTVISLGVAVKNHDDEDRDIVLVRYDSTGAELWTLVLDIRKEDQLEDAVLDGLGNVALTGRTGDGGDFDLLLASVDPAGTLLWQSIYAENHAVGEAIGLGPSGNIYVSGTYHPGSVDHFLLTAWSSDGTFLWDQIHSQMRRDGTKVVAADTPGGERVYATKPDSQAHRRRIVSWDVNGGDYRELDTDAQLGPIVLDAANGRILAAGEDDGHPYVVATDLDLAKLWDHHVHSYDGSAATLVALGDTWVASAGVKGIESDDVYTYQLDGSGTTILWDEHDSGDSGALTETHDAVVATRVRPGGGVVVVVNTDNDPRGLIGNLILDNQYETSTLSYDPAAATAVRAAVIKGHYASDARLDGSGFAYVNARWAVQPEDELRTLRTAKQEL